MDSMDAPMDEEMDRKIFHAKQQPDVRCRRSLR
jgi:hypothetical protein